MQKIKFYCDICKSEGTKSNFKKFSIDEKHPSKRIFGNVVGIQIYPKKYDVCNDCWEEILDLIQKLKETKGVDVNG